MKIKSERDFWAGMMFLLVGIGFAWGATTYSFGSSARPGPGYFPFGLGVLLALLGAVELFKALTIESEGGDPIGGIAWKPLIVILFAVGLLTQWWERFEQLRQDDSEIPEFPLGILLKDARLLNVSGQLYELEKARVAKTLLNKGTNGGY